MTVRRYETNPKAYPQVPFDMIKEAIVGTLIVALLIVMAAAAFGAPYVRPLTIKKVANQDPILFLRTAARELGGISVIAQYGPPYNKGTQGVQALGAFHPQTILGVTHPIDPANTDVLKPLRMASTLDPAIAAPLAVWQQATPSRRHAWIAAYLKVLPSAKVTAHAVVVPTTADGPVPVMLAALRKLAVGGLMSGALNRSTPVYRYDVAPSLLFLQGAALHQMARRQDLLGEQWGIMHDEQSYPGPWWLTPYTFLYQIPPYTTSPAGDLMATYTMLIVLAVLLLLPFIPGLRKLPHKLRVYRIIWRDWYRSVEGHAPSPRAASRPLGQPAHRGHAS